jgi:hypothetical protein
VPLCLILLPSSAFFFIRKNAIFRLFMGRKNRVKSPYRWGGGGFSCISVWWHRCGRTRPYSAFLNIIFPWMNFLCAFVSLCFIFLPTLS